MNEEMKNASGYVDQTAYEAIKTTDTDNERFHKLLATIFYITELAGFHIEGRIKFVDKRTGKEHN